MDELYKSGGKKADCAKDAQPAFAFCNRLYYLYTALS